MINKDDLMFEVVIGMVGGFLLFIALVQPLIDAIYWEY